MAQRQHRQEVDLPNQIDWDLWSEVQEYLASKLTPMHTQSYEVEWGAGRATSNDFADLRSEAEGEPISAVMMDIDRDSDDRLRILMWSRIGAHATALITGSGEEEVRGIAETLRSRISNRARIPRLASLSTATEPSSVVVQPSQPSFVRRMTENVGGSLIASGMLWAVNAAREIPFQIWLYLVAALAGGLIVEGAREVRRTVRRPRGIGAV